MASYFDRPVRSGGRACASYGNTRLNEAPPAPRRRPPLASRARALALMAIGAGVYHFALVLIG
jgi:hypothetical protein